MFFPTLRLLHCVVPIAILICGGFVDTNPAFAQFQRMRVPEGVFRLKPGQNNVAVLRANCVDASRGAPTSTDVLGAAASSPIKIARWPKGRPNDVVEQAISEVLGTWIEVRGNSRADSLDVTILQPEYEYEFRVGRGAPAILGPPSKEKAVYSADAEDLAKKLAASPVARAMERLDHFELALSDLFGKDAPEVETFRSIVTDEDFRGQTIYHALQEHPEPERLAELFLSTSKMELFSGATGAVNPDQIYRRLAFRIGKLLSTDQAKALDTLLGLENEFSVPEGIEAELKAFAADTILVRELFGTNAENQFNQSVIESLEYLDSYASAKVEARDSVLERIGVERRRLTPSLLNVAYALYLGKEPTVRQLDVLERFVGIRPAGKLPDAAHLRQGAADLATVLDTFPVDAVFVRESLVEALTDGKTPESVRRRLAQHFINTYAPALRGTRHPVDLCDSLFPDRFTQEQKTLLRSWFPTKPWKQQVYGDLIRLTLTEVPGKDELAVRLVGDGLDSSISMAEFSPGMLLAKVGKRQAIADQITLGVLVRLVSPEMRRELKRQITPLDDYLQLERQAAFVTDVSGEINVSRHVNADQADQMEVEMVRLRGNNNQGMGDGIIVHFPNDRILLIDTGNDREGLAQIEKRLSAHQAERVKQGKPLVVDILITHEDRDHIAGLLAILNRLTKPDGGIEVGNVVFGLHKAESSLAQNVLTELHELFHVEEFTQHLLIGKRKTETTSEIKFETEVFDDVCVTDVRGVGDARVSVYQVREPSSANDSSLVVRLEHNGVSQLLTGDIEVEAMQALLQSGKVNLNADIMKWPHHRSFPSDWTPSDKQIVRSFLLAVSPHTIAISNFGSKQTLEMEMELERFARDVLDNPITRLRVKFESTNDRLDPNKPNISIPGKSWLRQTRKIDRHAYLSESSLAA